MEQSPEDMDSQMMGEMDDYDQEGEAMEGEGEYGQEGEGEFDEYQGEPEEDPEMDFNNDPQYAGLPALDRMRKVRREILKTINDIRAKFNNPSIHQDVLSNRVASEYAEYLLQNEDAENEEILKSINEKHLVQEQARVLQGIAYLEEDVVSKDQTKMDEYMDAHGLLLELQEEMGELTNKKYTHVGVGFAHNTHKVKVVELLTSKPLHINSVQQREDGATEVRGCMLDAGAGIYAARIVAAANLKKEIAVSGPALIDFNSESREFTLLLKT